LVASYRDPDDPSQAAEVARLSAELDRLALRSPDDPPIDDALAALMPQVEAVGFPPLTARALTLDGDRLRRTRRFDDALARYQRAYSLARGAGADAIGLSAAHWIVWTLGVDQSKLDAVTPWVTQGLADAERYGLAHPEAMQMTTAAGVVAELQGDYARAVELQRRVIAAVGDVDDVARAAALVNLGTALDSSGRSADAIDAYRRALDVLRRELGPAHPRLTYIYSNLIIAQVATGAVEDALATSTEAVAQLDDVVGVDPYDAAMLRYNHGFALIRNERLDDAIALYRALRPELVTLAGEDSIEVADVDANTASALVDLGRYEEARAPLQRALAVRREVYGDDHQQTGTVLSLLGDVEEHRRGCAAGTPYWDRAMAAFHATEAHGGVAGSKPETLLRLAQCARRAGRARHAVELLEEARAAAETARPDTLRVAVLSELAEAQLAAGDADRARATMIGARDVLHGLSAADAGRRGDLGRLIDAWLAAHPAR
ncbi:MAG: tetratricopeptide repeat protein, partial [Myxococcales bacterium]|nr:tetratricopeptide repeat protein [Myxococcales bacterium]